MELYDPIYLQRGCTNLVYENTVKKTTLRFPVTNSARNAVWDVSFGLENI